MKKIFTLFAAVLFAGSMSAVYNLTKVTAVEDGGLYVFERNSRVLIGTSSSDKLQSTSEYSTAGLSGTELYVWRLDAIEGDVEKGYCITNMGKYSQDPNGHIQLSNASGGTKLTLANASASAWVFEFTDGIALISNKANSNRFIGETSDGSGEYKAYATQNLEQNGHDFTVYKLEESSDPFVSVSPATIDFGTVKKDAYVAAKEVTVSFGNLTGAVTYSGLTAPFTAEGTIAASGDKITISASTATAGEYSQTLTVQSAADSKSATVTVTMNVVEGADPSAAFELFTDALVEGDYVIYYDGAAMNNTVSSDRLQFDAVTPVNDVISGPDAAIVWHIAKSGDYWTIYNADVNKYAAGTGAKNKAQLLASGTDDKSLWSVSASAGKFDFTNKANNAASVNAILRKNGTYGFACYASGTGGALTLYKKATGAPAAVAKPAISGSENFQDETTVSITCATDGAEIFYTLDGSEPTKEATKFVDAFKLTESTTVKAIAIKGEDKSAISTKEFHAFKSQYTCAEAAELAMTVSGNNIPVGEGLEFIIEGYVTEITYAYGGSNMSFWMADEADGDNTLQAYKVEPESAEAVPEVGDKVKVTGKLTKYNTDPQVAAGGKCVILEKGGGGGGEESQYEDDENADFNIAFASYTVNDQSLAEDGDVYVEAQDANNNYIVLDIMVPEDVDGLVAGTYPVDATETYPAQTVVAGIYDEGVYPSFAAVLSSDGENLEKVWYIVSGTVVIDADLNITVTAKNSLGKDVKATLAGPKGTGVEKNNVAAKAVKTIENGMIVIELDGVRHNIIGQVIR